MSGHASSIGNTPAISPIGLGINPVKPRNPQKPMSCQDSAVNTIAHKTIPRGLSTPFFADSHLKNHSFTQTSSPHSAAKEPNGESNIESTRTSDSITTIQSPQKKTKLTAEEAVFELIHLLKDEIGLMKGEIGSDTKPSEKEIAQRIRDKLQLYSTQTEAGTFYKISTSEKQIFIANNQNSQSNRNLDPNTYEMNLAEFDELIEKAAFIIKTEYSHLFNDIPVKENTATTLNRKTQKFDEIDNTVGNIAKKTEAKPSPRSQIELENSSLETKRLINRDAKELNKAILNERQKQQQEFKDEMNALEKSKEQTVRHIKKDEEKRQNDLQQVMHTFYSAHQQPAIKI